MKNREVQPKRRLYGKPQYFPVQSIRGCKKFSGGKKTRIKVANAFSSGNLLVFADEPTANLDYKGIELLKQKLSGVDSLHNNQFKNKSIVFFTDGADDIKNAIN